MFRSLFAALALFLFAFLPAQAADVALGQAIVPLNGPWSFAVGDDAHWAAPDFDDSHWQHLDLTPPPGAHDGDVGLKGYVGGWNAHGHRGYAGFAWYRMVVSTNNTNDTLWLVGPAAVDSAYQVFFNGHLLGGIGDFARNPPSVVGIQPRLFALPRAWWTKSGSRLSGVVAFRVYLGRGDGATASADGGGIHIAPLLGTTKGAGDHYQLQWLQTVEGYIVDVTLPVFLWLLAVLALCVWPFEPRERFYPWLAASLLFLGLARFNQGLFFFGQFETFRDFVIWRLAIIDALILGTWTMAWLTAFNRTPPRWSVIASIALTVLYVLARVFSAKLLVPSFAPGVTHAFADVLQAVRLGVLALLFYAAWFAVRRHTRADIAGLLAMVTGSIGLFASEVSVLGIPGIWFPFGVGVSRTQYAYAILCPLLFIYLIIRLWRFAGSHAHTA